jgi:branched-subunit amino acid aminotransferase/4-amino-4-deoxychorismate lyase
MHAMAFEFFSRNGEILPITDAVVPLSNIEYAYGFGVYENIRVVHGKILFTDDHVERLLHSAIVIRLEHEFAKADIAHWIGEFVQKIASDACNLKILLIGGRTAKDATLTILALAPLFPDRKLYKTGATAVTVQHERYLPQAKTLNMLPSYMAYRTAKAKGGYDALLINRDGCITEGTRTNFFCIKSKTIISPPQKEILEGVTLKHVLQVAKENGYEVRYEPIPLSSVASFDGAFLTSTSSKIMPLSKIDDITLKIPDALVELMKKFDEFLDQ